MKLEPLSNTGNYEDEIKARITMQFEADSSDIFAKAISASVERCKKLAEESKLTTGEAAAAIESMTRLGGVSLEEAFKKAKGECLRTSIDGY